MAQPFYLDGLHFSCKRCSRCCTKESGYVYLSKKDLSNILSCLNLTKEEFVDTYCRWVPYYDGSEVLCLLEKSNYDCIFWEDGCKVYNGRPVQCRTYPFWSFTLKDEKTWKDESITCPGIDSGEFHDFAQIKKAKDEYDSNLPIKKNEFYGE